MEPDSWKQENNSVANLERRHNQKMKTLKEQEDATKREGRNSGESYGMEDVRTYSAQLLRVRYGRRWLLSLPLLIHLGSTLHQLHENY